MRPLRVRSILVAMDDSAPAETALAQARSLAQTLHARLEVLRVEPWVHSGLGLWIADPQATARRALAALPGLRRLAGRGRAVHSVPGDAVDNILRWCRYGDFDLLVVGTHGRRGVERALHPSVAAAVARGSRVPVLVVGRAREAVRRILAPVILEPHGFAGLEAAAGLAAELGARLTVLHVSPPGRDPRAALELLRKALALLPERTLRACGPVLQVAHGEPEERILGESARHDLVAVCARRPEPWLDAIVGSTVQRLLRQAPCPVLVAPSPRPASSLRLPRLDPARAPIL
ncbi:MAG: universal stress protein [Elusimicrobia bacterium]|nr:universal stress protein [Elusimicrobiota bacterium]